MLVWFKIQMFEKRHGVHVFISLYNVLHSLSISLFYNEIFLRTTYSIGISCFLSEYMNVSQQQLSLFSWLIIIDTLWAQPYYPKSIKPIFADFLRDLSNLICSNIKLHLSVLCLIFKVRFYINIKLHLSVLRLILDIKFKDNDNRLENNFT